MELDNKLYNDYFNGEDEAFNFLYNKYKEKIKYFIYNIVHDYQKAEDLTQETFIYVMQNKMKENCNFKYYIYLKAKCLALNSLNTENRRSKIVELYLLNDTEQNEKDILECILNEENKRELIEAINCLDEKYKNAIYLTKIEGLSYIETSKILGERIENTKQIVHRGKIQLRKILIKKGFDEMNKVAKVLIIMLIAITFVGGFGYAVSNIKIFEKPVIDWFKVNFSDEYENYREEVHGEIIQAPNESSIELVSTVCDEGFVILEFDIKLSAEDKKHLKIGNPVLTEEYLNATDDEDSRTLEEDYNKETHQFSVQTKKEMIKKMAGDKIIEDTIRVGCNLQPGALKDSKILQKTSNKNIIIDGEYIYAQLSPQSVKKISEYEYKLYQMYFLTEKELGDKTEFTVTMKDFIITTTIMEYGDTDTCLKIDGQFDIKLSKEKALENSRKIEVSDEKIVYKDKELTQKIESVVVTPLQTIIKVHSIYEDVTYSKLTDSTSEEHIGIREYKVFNESGGEINSYNFETKRMITYADGKEEEWDSGQIEPTKIPFKNGTLEIIDYILIENDNNSKIKVLSQERNGLINGIKKVECTDIGSFEIDLTKEKKN